MHRDESGQALPLLALSLATMVLTVWLLVGLADRTRDRSRAQNAADAAALAGAAADRAGAERLAAANGGELVAFDADGLAVTVVVVVDGVRAEASAERYLAPPGG